MFFQTQSFCGGGGGGGGGDNKVYTKDPETVVKHVRQSTTLYLMRRVHIYPSQVQIRRYILYFWGSSLYNIHNQHS